MQTLSLKLAFRLQCYHVHKQYNFHQKPTHLQMVTAAADTWLMNMKGVDLTTCVQVYKYQMYVMV